MNVISEIPLCYFSALLWYLQDNADGVLDLFIFLQHNWHDETAIGLLSVTYWWSAMDISTSVMQCCILGCIPNSPLSWLPLFFSLSKPVAYFVPSSNVILVSVGRSAQGSLSVFPPCLGLPFSTFLVFACLGLLSFQPGSRLWNECLLSCNTTCYCYGET